MDELGAEPTPPRRTSEPTNTWAEPDWCYGKTRWYDVAFRAVLRLVGLSSRYRGNRWPVHQPVLADFFMPDEQRRAFRPYCRRCGKQLRPDQVRVDWYVSGSGGGGSNTPQKEHL